MDEWVDLVDGEGRIIGRAPRATCHRDPSLTHRAVHILVFNASGEILLQLRSKTKEIQPGRWDTSVGGHLAAGESYEAAAGRELFEELGVRGADRLVRMYDYLWRTAVETERVRSFYLAHEGPFCMEPGEIEALRFFSSAEVESRLRDGSLTPNFEEEWARYKARQK